MLHEIDAALRGLLGGVLPETTPIRFDAPDRTWRAGDIRAIDVFLTGVREDLTARRSTFAEQRDGDGRVFGRQPPVRRYYVSYLVTAWGEDAEDEHRMLGLAMAALTTTDVIPTEHLAGSLRAAQLPVTVAVAHPDFGGVTPDLWSALGIAPRASLDVVVAAALVPALLTDLADVPRRVALGVAKMPPTAAVPADGGPITSGPRRFVPKENRPERSVTERS